MNLKAHFDKESAKIERALGQCLPRPNEHPARLHQAMRYSVLGGGKRVRPILALEACRAVGGRERAVMPAACALELIHNYSLVHDDMPCMDDDTTRRGRPTCHKKYGEDTALLVGDGLLTLAFRLLCDGDGVRVSEAARRLEAARLVAEAVGSRGMVGGQAVDIEYQGKEPDLPTLEYINTRKSGALIAVAVRVGAYLGGGSPRQVEGLYRYGKYVGFLFQIVDDILDGEGYAKAIGVPEVRRKAAELVRKAKNQLKPFSSQGRILGEIADFILTRKH